jgi:hypothetical protein
VKKRFQSLPFKCNLQRYTAEEASRIDLTVAGASPAKPDDAAAWVKVEGGAGWGARVKPEPIGR